VSVEWFAALRASLVSRFGATYLERRQSPKSPMEERYLAFCAFDDAAPRDGAPTSPALIEKEPIHHAAGT